MAKKDKVTFLDVTLRDGGYQNNWDFSQENATAIVNLLYGAGVSFIEIGYRNCPPKESNVGLTGKTPDDYIRILRNEAPNAKLSVMYSPSLIKEEDLDKMAELGVSMVRCSLPHAKQEEAFPLIKRGADLGMISTANFTNVTEYKMDVFIDLANRIIDNGCSVIYVADSNGSMIPESVNNLFETLREELHPIKLGFHNHNMLGMAMANAIEAIRSGVDYLDGSLRGMGRSAGNVSTEFLITYLSRIYPDDPYNVRNIIRAARYLCENFTTANPHPILEDMAYGAYDFDSLLCPLITEAATEFDVSWYSLISKMSESELDKPKITLDTVREVAKKML